MLKKKLKKASIEIIGLPGSGKTTLFNKLKESNVFDKYLFKKNNLIIEKVKLCFNVFYDFFLILLIFDFFIDELHTKSIISISKRILKLNLILFNSKKISLSLNNSIIYESLIHLAINSNNQNINKLHKYLLKIYRTEKLKLIYLKLTPEETLIRMTNRGDKIKSFEGKLYQRYIKSIKLYDELIKYICLDDEKNVLIVNQKGKLETYEEVINWLNTL